MPKKFHSIGIFLSCYRVCNTFVISCNENVILCNKSVIFQSRLLEINAYKFAETIRIDSFSGELRIKLTNCV